MFVKKAVVPLMSLLCHCTEIDHIPVHERLVILVCTWEVFEVKTFMRKH